MNFNAVHTRKAVAITVLLAAAVVVFPLQRLQWFSPTNIQVFAGADKVLCQYQNLVVAELNATISGDVADGDWFTFGDGRFQPGNLITVRYSLARQGQVTYVPGPGDKALGYYKLMLMSDVPVNNPQERATDDVRITFQAAPPLFCTSNFTLSLNEFCQQQVDVTMLHPNPVAPYNHYIITLYDKDGKTIPGNLLNYDHINTEVTFRLGHQCTTNHCIGRFRVDDYYPPVFVCRNDTLTCDRPTLPDSVGLPIPKRAEVDTIIKGKYYISNWDYCSDVVLEYKDDIIQANCARNDDRVIRRNWVAVDAKGNKATCTQTILVKRLSLPQVKFPRNYDDQDAPAFQCRDTFPVLATGHPSPDTTGLPLTGYCGNLQYTMQDVRFDLCGKAFKIARSWFLIDWCTSESVSRIQIIVVKDTRPPVLTCRDTVRLAADPYICALPTVPIPDIISADDCSSFSIAHSLKDLNGNVPLFGGIIKAAGVEYLTDIPVGTYYLEYAVTDQCQNTAWCTSVLIIEDRTAPAAVCHQFATVSLDNVGKGRLFASSLDDGSSDNCGIAHFKVRKVSGECFIGTSYTDYVEFCCDEFGKTVMVELQVTDVYGLSNICMVNVRVDDKIKPLISCPPQLTVSCTANLDQAGLSIYGQVVTDAALVRPVVINNAFHQGRVGYDGLATDNCQVTVRENVYEQLSCFTGNIRRVFIATDAVGNSDSCFQLIHVKNPDPFSIEDIQWPAHFEGQGCRSSQTGPDITGRPAFTNLDCANVAASFVDQSFFSAEGACLKIFRSWTVIDWCQFDGTSQQGKFGPYTQVIKVFNTDVPVFGTSCRDTVICSFDPGCADEVVRLSAEAHDPCTPDEFLLWRYTLDIGNNGQIDLTGQSNTILEKLPFGTHSIKWHVEDQCGNGADCIQKITIKDCKKPTPYCVGALSAALDQQSGDVEVAARDFDNGSFDNCSGNIFFTFGSVPPVKTLLGQSHYFDQNGISDAVAYQQGKAQQWLPAMKTSSLRFSCNDIPDGKATTIPLKMSVWDAEGNQDYCEVQLLLQDNAGVCPDQVTTASLEGRIVTDKGKVPQGIVVGYKGLEKEGQVSVSTDGKYNISDLPIHADYVVTPSLNTDPLEGITTMDLVLIQRHILGLSPFGSTVQRIAADVNGSASISASDLLDLRRLILGISTSFPKGMPSWVFADKKSMSQNPLYPFDYRNYIDTSLIESHITGLDFTAIKLGDVNGSALALANPSLQERSLVDPYTIHVQAEWVNGSRQIVYRAAESEKLYGFQFFGKLSDALNENGIDKEINEVAFPSTHIYIDAADVSCIGFSSNPIEVKAGDILATMPWDGSDHFPVVLSPLRRSEVYSENGESRPVILLNKTATGDQMQFALQSNPVLQVPVVYWQVPQSGVGVQFSLYNNYGSLLLTTSQLCAGSGELTLPMPEGISGGTYFLKIRTGEGIRTLPFVLIK